ncbi:response regulator [Fulvivirga sp. RKSG066]|uniref:response regulator n=1 Tax=Fulvivirga aurantia TaxID=2529383 RepID=UPI0012BCDC9B|nr:response regulator [Fulvivirga aurantia]MTI21143.1 response regulator [Fulvivirga aurantia]
MKILLIDDTLSLLDEIKDILLMEGYEVITATNGFDGLGQVSSKKPDVIITDLVMPEMNGYKLIEKIKSIDKFRSIPIIVLSAQAAKEDKDQAFALKADKYLTKPCPATVLIDAIEEIRSK